MIRRNFFKTLFGTIGAALVSPHVAITPTVSNVVVEGYKGFAFMGGYIYCPYIPIIKTRELPNTNDFKPPGII